VTALWQFWQAHRAELGGLIEQHLALVLISTAVAVAIGVPAGVLAARRPRLGRPLLFAANVAQTIPSLALFGFLLPLPFIGGVGPRTALVALTLYALLPIVRTTVAGLGSVDRAVVDAGVAMGMTSRQLLWIVELPLALPSIVAGIRVAAVIGVGTATIAAAIGAGGLGEYIFRGLSMVDTTTILAGAVPAAFLALVVDGLLAWTERALTPGRRSRSAAAAGALAAALLLVAGVVWLSARTTTAQVAVGSKNFTEQIVLGEIVARALEDEGLPVARRLNLGGTFICDRAVRSGDIDIYVEYTGTAVTAVFHEPVPHDPRVAFDRTRELYARQGLTAQAPLGFNNTFAILVRSADARAFQLTSIDDLVRVAGRWRPGFGYEFLQREDGYPGLIAAYGLRFGNAPRSMDLSLIYKALAEGQVDVIAGDATSALIDALQLTMLEDTRKYFPPYDAVPVVRTAALLEHPEIGRALARLAGRITEADMRAMNRAVDLDRRDPAEVAREFVAALPRR
jgi:osmoprotectant transport system substrate-binding protein/osmoprotectant transport system permease protein